MRRPLGRFNISDNMIKSFKSYSRQLKLVLLLLFVLSLIPIIWYALGATISTIPIVTNSIIIWIFAAGVFPLLGLVGLLLGKMWGKKISLVAVSFMFISVVVFFVLEAIRTIFSNYHDPLIYMLIEFGLLVGFMVILRSAIIWLKNTSLDQIYTL